MPEQEPTSGDRIGGLSLLKLWIGAERQAIDQAHQADPNAEFYVKDLEGNIINGTPLSYEEAKALWNQMLINIDGRVSDIANGLV